MRHPTLPFPAAERAIQRLWSESRLRFPARAASGATVELLSPGQWNRLGGPDFLGTELRVDGRRVTRVRLRGARPDAAAEQVGT